MKGRLLLALLLALGTPACSQAPTAPAAKRPEAKPSAAAPAAATAREVEAGPAPPEGSIAQTAASHVSAQEQGANVGHQAPGGDGAKGD